MPIAIKAVSPEQYEAWANAAVDDLDAAYELIDEPAAAGSGDETGNDDA